MPSPYIQAVYGVNRNTGQGGQLSGPMPMSGMGSVMGMANQFAQSQVPPGYYAGGYGQGPAVNYMRPSGGGTGGYASLGYRTNPNSFVPGGAPGGGYPGGGGGGGGPNPGIMGLLNAQMGENQWARQNNERNWQMARDRLLGIEGNYNRDPIVAATRGRVGGMLANPEAINDRVQSLIQNKAANSIDAQTAALNNRLAGVLSAGGQSDAASIAAMQERTGRAAMAQRQGVQSALEVQRANQRNRDIYDAINAGRGQNAENFGLQTGIANSLLTNLPQYQPMDVSGYIAALGQGQGGGGYGGMAGGYGGGYPGGMQPGFDAGFTGWQGGANPHIPLGGRFTAQHQAMQEAGRPGPGWMSGGTGLMQFAGPQDAGRAGYQTDSNGVLNRWDLARTPALQEQLNQEAINNAFTMGPPRF